MESNIVRGGNVEGRFILLKFDYRKLVFFTAFAFVIEAAFLWPSFWSYHSQDTIFQLGAHPGVRYIAALGILFFVVTTSAVLIRSIRNQGSAYVQDAELVVIYAFRIEKIKLRDVDLSGISKRQGNIWINKMSGGQIMLPLFFVEKGREEIVCKFVRELTLLKNACP